MTKHVLDRPRDVSTNLVKRAVEIARRKLPSPATLALQRRSKVRKSDQRAKVYARIERAQQH